MRAFKSTSRRWHNTLLAAASLLVALLICEAALRLFLPQKHPYTTDGTSTGDVVYSEFQRERINIYVPGRRPPGSRIVRPNPAIFHGLSPEITFTVDQFGFRSARPVTLEKPAGTIRIMAVGGSTTENNLLDDREVWTELLHQRLFGQRAGVEVINTARSGDNTRDHIALLSQVLVAFHPDVALFLVGVNDLELQMKPDYSSLRNDRRSFAGDGSRVPFLTFVKVWACDWWHFARLAIWSIRGSMTTDEKGNPVEDTTGAWVAMKREELRRLPVRNVDVSRWPGQEYEQNLRTLIGVSRVHHIEPVLMTQPAIWGAPPGEWERTLWVHPHPDFRVTPDQLWKLLESFNDVTRRVGSENDVKVIDLARLLPKTADMFVDDDHYTVAGQQRIAAIIESELSRLGWDNRLIAASPNR
jgi:lysophospholipase L1-like esterase